LLGLSCQPVRLVPDKLEDYITQLANEQLDFGLQNALSIAVYDQGNWTSYHHGQLSPFADERPDDATLYALGELTELFTTTLMAEQILEGRLSAEDSVAKDYPGALPNFNGAAMTYQDLATHTAGFPRRITDGWNKAQLEEEAAFFQDFNLDDLYFSVATWEPNAPPGVNYIPSDLGMSVLAHMLELRSGEDYYDLLRNELLLSLGMNDTRDLKHFDQARADRLAPAWSLNGDALPVHTYGEYQGGISHWSTLADLKKWISAHLDPFHPLADAVDLCTKEQFVLGNGRSSGYGWQIRRQAGGPVYLRSGEAQHTCQIRFSRQEQRAVIVLSNTLNAEGTDWIGAKIWGFW
jgi:D-alanyl-D-alanine-carboxypeptidase/D-alanyl-D-alanine-endopeptidase